MNCPSIEDLALLIDSEQTPVDLAEHISQCADCQGILAEFKANSQFLRSAPDIPDDAIVMVRRSVMDRLPKRKRVPLAWLAAAAALCVAVIVPTLLNDRSEMPVVLPPPVERVREPVRTSPPPPSSPAASARKKRTARVAGPDLSSLTDAEVIAALDGSPERDQPVAAAPEGTAVLTLPTKDPNVTIILFDDKTGDRK